MWIASKTFKCILAKITRNNSPKEGNQTIERLKPVFFNFKFKKTLLSIEY